MCIRDSFDTVEVETMLSLLAVVDNPFQDIPLACVLKSPIIGMSEEELAWLAANYKQTSRKNKYGDRGLYSAVRLWLSEDERTAGKETDTADRNQKITDKLKKLEEMLLEYRLLDVYKRQSVCLLAGANCITSFVSGSVTSETLHSVLPGVFPFIEEEKST